MDTPRGAFTAALLSLGPTARPRDAARALAGAGVPVFPVASQGKQPVTVHGFRDATTELAVLEAWWTRMPGANIAIPTGSVSGVVVVDVDVHGPVDGFQALGRAQRAGLVDGWELLVRSPSGGLHAYFPADPAGEQRSWQAARAGIDFRGDGGYIITPPSARTIGNQRATYAIEKVNPGATMLLDAGRLRNFLDPPPQHRPPRDSATVARGGVDVERLAGWVARLREGERNHGLFWAACTMAEHDVPALDALDTLIAAGGHAGLSEREVSTTVRSAYRTVHGAPTTTQAQSSSAPLTASFERMPTMRAPASRGLS